MPGEFNVISTTLFLWFGRSDVVFHAKPWLLWQQILMMRRELSKDPSLATENWDRFLPRFKKYAVHSSIPFKACYFDAFACSGISHFPFIMTSRKNVKQKKVKTKVKKSDTPFPPPQPPSKVSLTLPDWCGYICHEFMKYIYHCVCVKEIHLLVVFSFSLLFLTFQPYSIRMLLWARW